MFDPTLRAELEQRFNGMVPLAPEEEDLFQRWAPEQPWYRAHVARTGRAPDLNAPEPRYRAHWQAGRDAPPAAPMVAPTLRTVAHTTPEADEPVDSEGYLYRSRRDPPFQSQRSTWDEFKQYLDNSAMNLARIPHELPVLAGKAARDFGQMARDLMSLAPLSGNAIALQDSQRDAQAALDDWRAGDPWGAAVNGTASLFDATGAVLGAGAGILGRGIKSAKALHPGYLRGLPTSPEENYRRGLETVTEAFKQKADAPQAMYSPDFGWINMPWGFEGDAAREFKGGMGLSHIFAKRATEGMSEDEVGQMIARVLAHGKVDRIYGPPNARRANIVFGDHLASLSLFKDGDRETWLLTGFDHRKQPR